MLDAREQNNLSFNRGLRLGPSRVKASILKRAQLSLTSKFATKVANYKIVKYKQDR